MALLTEEQIKQLVKMASVTSTATSYHEDLCEWNEKQTTIQFEVDWKDAPKHATKAQLRLYWVTESLGSELWSGSDLWDSVIIERPTPVVTPHPHATLMTKYAEVAARRHDPWVEFEIKNTENEWIGCAATCCFYHKNEYRHIGDDK